MILPGLYAILSPLAVGFLIGPKCLTGLLAGSIASGMMLAIMMANAGGAWDNAKKYIEIEGAAGGKVSEKLDHNARTDSTFSPTTFFVPIITRELKLTRLVLSATRSVILSRIRRVLPLTSLSNS